MMKRQRGWAHQLQLCSTQTFPVVLQCLSHSLLSRVATAMYPPRHALPLLVLPTQSLFTNGERAVFSDRCDDVGEHRLAITPYQTNMRVARVASSCGVMIHWMGAWPERAFRMQPMVTRLGLMPTAFHAFSMQVLMEQSAPSSSIISSYRAGE